MFTTWGEHALRRKAAMQAQTSVTFPYSIPAQSNTNANASIVPRGDRTALLDLVYFSSLSHERRVAERMGGDWHRSRYIPALPLAPTACLAKELGPLGQHERLQDGALLAVH